MAPRGQTAARKEVWDRPPPRTAKHTKLSPEKKASAKARAKRAGRPYPNLVDNIRAARKSPATRKSPAKASRKSGKVPRKSS